MKFWFLDPGDVNHEAVSELADALPDQYEFNAAEVQEGTYGPTMQNAVKAFQLDNGITVDARVGRETWERLLVNQ